MWRLTTTRAIHRRIRLTRTRARGSVGLIHPVLVHRMPDDDAKGEDKDSLLTPRMVIEVLRGRGTPEEQELVRSALKDPHSVVHDWLEGMEDWAQRAFRGSSRRAKAADRLLQEGAARHDYNDVIAFIRELGAAGHITNHEMDTIFETHSEQESATRSTATFDYRGAAMRMLDAIVSAHPELSDATQRVRVALGRGLDPGKGR